MRTHYDLLNVSEGALDEVIRAAYRVLARRYHPDRNDNSAQSVQRMQALNDAYAVLTDPVRRRQYDETLRDERHRQSHTQAAFQAQAQVPAAAVRPHYAMHRSPRRFQQTAGQKVVAFLFNDPRITALLFIGLLFVGRQIFSKPERSYPSVPPPAHSHPYYTPSR